MTCWRLLTHLLKLINHSPTPTWFYLFYSSTVYKIRENLFSTLEHAWWPLLFRIRLFKRGGRVDSEDSRPDEEGIDHSRGAAQVNASCSVEKDLFIGFANGTCLFGLKRIQKVSKLLASESCPKHIWIDDRGVFRPPRQRPGLSSQGQGLSVSKNTHQYIETSHAVLRALSRSVVQPVAQRQPIRGTG